MEQAIISGIAHDTSEAKVTIREVPDQPGIAAAIFRPLADAGVNVDMIVQNVSAKGHTDVSFTVPKSDLATTEPVLAEIARAVGGQEITTDTDVAKISLVGAGMKTHPGVAADMFDALAEAGHQHRDHLDLDDPDLVPDPRRRRRPGGARRARPLPARRARRARGGVWRALTSPSRCSATGRSARRSTGC